MPAFDTGGARKVPLTRDVEMNDHRRFSRGCLAGASAECRGMAAGFGGCPSNGRICGIGCLQPHRQPHFPMTSNNFATFNSRLPGHGCGAIVDSSSV
jgi:hypothetical protein